MFCIFLCILLLLCFVRYCLLAPLFFDSLVETFVAGLVLVPLSSIVHVSNYNNASLASTSFQWLLMFPSKGSDRFALIRTPFASVTTLYSSLRRPGYLFDSFLILHMYFCTFLVRFGFIIEEPTLFWVLGPSTIFSFESGV